MFSALAPERAGCNAKLAFMETVNLQATMFPGMPQADFFVSSFPTNAELISSIDKIGRFCEDLALFSKVALCHAIRDINAGIASPLVADFCFEFGNDLPDEAARTEFVRNVSESCKQYGVIVGKCHSVYAAITSLTISISGYRQKQATAPEASRTGVIILTSKLGAFKEIYLEEQGHNRPRSALARQSLCFDYSPLVAHLGTSIYDMADVSGFGLGGCLSSLATRNELSLFVEFQHSISLDESAEPISCLQSDMPPNVLAQDESLRVVLNQREVAGPLVLLARGNGKDVISFLNNYGLSPEVIGKFHNGAGMVSAKWL